MSVHRYPPQTLIGDYTRAGIGLLMTIPPLFFGPGTAITLALLIVACVCLFFVTRTVERHRAIVSFDDDAIELKSFQSSRVRWENLARVTMSYYAVKRDKSGGWMELVLKDDKATVKLDSRLEGFLGIVVKAAQVARERRIPLNQITLSNFKALNITGE